MDDTTTEDRFLDGRVIVRQPVDGPRAGLDAVMLAAFAPVRGVAGESVLDVGCGPGTVALLLSQHSAAARITGVDIDDGLIALARDNATANAVAARLRFETADILRPLAELAPTGLVAEAFDLVVSNPPFFSLSGGTPSREAVRRRAHFAEPGALDAWFRFMTSMTRQGGRLAAIVPASEIALALAALSSRFGALRVFPLFPRSGQPARRVLIAGIRGSRAPAQLLEGMVLHQPDGGPTTEAAAVLRLGSRIPLDFRQ